MQALPLLLLATGALLGSTSAFLQPELTELSATLFNEAEPVDAAAAPQCDVFAFGTCLHNFENKFNYTAKQQTNEGLNAALQNYVAQGAQNVQNLCGFNNAFTTCVNALGAGQRKACLSTSNLMYLLRVNQTEAMGVQSTLYAMSAECALNSSLQVILNNYGCYQNVSMSSVQMCVKAGNASYYNLTIPGQFCSVYGPMLFSCIPKLYSNCSVAMEQAVCQLSSAALHANPNFASLTANCTTNCSQLGMTTTTPKSTQTTTKGAATSALSALAFAALAALLIWQNN